jgi:hypothetical protein
MVAKTPRTLEIHLMFFYCTYTEEGSSQKPKWVARKNQFLEEKKMD